MGPKTVKPARLLLMLFALQGCALDTAQRGDASSPIDTECMAICARFVTVCGRTCQLGDCVTGHDEYAGCPTATEALFSCARAATDDELCHLGATTCGPEVLVLTTCLTSDAGM